MDHDEPSLPAIVDVFIKHQLPKIRAVGKRIRLGIFQVECVHASVKSMLSNKSGGAPIDSITMSATNTLERFRMYHRHKLGFKSLKDVDKHRAHQRSEHHNRTCSKAYAIRRSLAVGKKRVKRTNGWNIFREDYFARLKRAYPNLHTFARVPAFEDEIKTAWHALPCAEKRVYSSASKASNSNFVKPKTYKSGAAKRRRRRGLPSAPPQPAAAAPPPPPPQAPPGPARGSLWGLGSSMDPDEPLRPELLLKDFGFSRTSARAAAASQSTPLLGSPGLRAQMVAAARKYVPTGDEFGLSKAALGNEVQGSEGARKPRLNF